MTVRHVVMFSGGVGSFAAADRVVREHGRDVTLLFADTLIEDADLYRFLVEAAAFLTGRAGVGEVSGLAARAANTPPSSDMPARRAHLDRLRADVRQVIPGLVWLADGRTPWDVFRDKRFLGTARVAQCSAVLKQRVADDWLAKHCQPETTRVYVGIDWMEEHRFVRLQARHGTQGWNYRAPLCEPPVYTKDAGFARLRDIGIVPCRLYDLGFSHSNCGGGCVRAGVSHFAHLYRTLPAVYAEWEQGEADMRAFLERDDIAILRDRTGGDVKPLTLIQLRRRLDDGHQPDLFDIGGCGCFVDTEAA
jgi:hypothetical protein